MSDVDKLKKDVQGRMNASVDVARKEFAGLRTGRASTALLEPIEIEAYGSMTPLNQVASISAPEPRMLSVQVWDRSMAKAVEKAIRESDLGLNPAADGQLIRVPIPALNEERRAELVKVAGKYAEAARVAVRNVRRDGNEHLKRMEKDGDISQDELHKLTDDIQKMTDSAVKAIDAALAEKEQEIMQV